ncbi:hypothetical protein PV08_08229 [Exophiala spinifera]|uniref:Uncharacterized protein n=1 Tax=Exophiala spinifera TaxID=91928 RepID=A0A0D1ZJR8_9EURO|nr:uncharacterized protein PV08_08229 [Exophiala spinifera]KIW13042.1 hypothetical protein PV08_08229 [Exophiala spinifera]
MATSTREEPSHDIRTLGMCCENDHIYDNSNSEFAGENVQALLDLHEPKTEWKDCLTSLGGLGKSQVSLRQVPGPMDFSCMVFAWVLCSVGPVDRFSNSVSLGISTEHNTNVIPRILICKRQFYSTMLIGADHISEVISLSRIYTGEFCEAMSFEIFDEHISQEVIPLGLIYREKFYETMSFEISENNSKEVIPLSGMRCVGGLLCQHGNQREYHLKWNRDDDAQLASLRKNKHPDDDDDDELPGEQGTLHLPSMRGPIRDQSSTAHDYRRTSLGVDIVHVEGSDSTYLQC